MTNPAALAYICHHPTMLVGLTEFATLKLYVTVFESPTGPMLYESNK